MAKVAQDSDSILLTHDGDFKTVAPRVPTGQRRRFKKLSKIHLTCKQSMAAVRVAAAIELVEFEWAGTQSRNDKRLHMVIQPHVIKTHR